MHKWLVDTNHPDVLCSPKFNPHSSCWFSADNEERHFQGIPFRFIPNTRHGHSHRTIKSSQRYGEVLRLGSFPSFRQGLKPGFAGFAAGAAHHRRCGGGDAGDGLRAGAGVGPYCSREDKSDIFCNHYRANKYSTLNDFL